MFARMLQEQEDGKLARETARRSTATMAQPSASSSTMRDGASAADASARRPTASTARMDGYAAFNARDFEQFTVKSVLAR